MLSDMKEKVKLYINEEKAEGANKAKTLVLYRDLELNTSKLTQEEW